MAHCSTRAHFHGLRTLCGWGGEPAVSAYFAGSCTPVPASLSPTLLFLLTSFQQRPE